MDKQGRKYRVRDMAMTALFAAVLCAVAPFSVAVGPIPLSLATLVVYLASGSLGWRHGTISVLLYVIIGAVGLPVFTNFEGGFHKIAGVTGGYIIGYIPCALVTGLIGVSLTSEKRKVWPYAIGMVTGTVLLYTCGTAWFMLQTGSRLAAALALCVMPFLIGDVIKIIVACLTAPKLRNALRSASRG